MAVRLTLLAAPLLGVTLVLLALLPPSSHVASAAAAGPAKTAAATPAPPGNVPRSSLPCSGAKGGEGDAATRGKRDTKASGGCTMVAAATAKNSNGDRRVAPEEEAEGPRMSKRAAPEGPEALPAEKRAPSSSSFFGMRGKKDGEAEALKRAPSYSGFFGMRGKKEDPTEELEGVHYDLEDMDMAEKRVPSSNGFFGMRGKKFQKMDYNPWYRDPKRARMGFFGMRGKKSEMGDMGWEDDKRAPSSMGFFGTRGKKWGEDGVVYGWGPDELDPEEKRAPQSMSFFGMRGKKSGEEEDEEEGPEKRAPMGFFGMRGKKDYADDEDYEDLYGEASKRAPMGFFGMRGKKAYSGYWSEGGDNKRAPMGFFGMRGKRDEAEGPVEMTEEEKRAPNHMSFFGMRGKKDDKEEDEDMGWYPLHSAEAKRGLAGAAISAWPASSRTPNSINTLLAYLAGRDAAIAEAEDRTGSGWRPVRKRFRGSKKAPMGFIGMRGKKADSISKEVWPPSSNLSGDNGYETDTKLQDGGEGELVYQNPAEGGSQ